MELIELDAARVRTDLLGTPQSILPMGVKDIERLLGGAPEAREAAPAATEARAAPTAAAAPAPSPPPSPVIAAAPGTLQQVLQQHLALLARRGMRLGDTFNVLAAGVIAVAGKEVAAQGAARPCLDIVSDIAMLRGRALIDCRAGEERIIVLLDPLRGRVEALYTHGDAAYTGLQAMEKAAGLRPTEVKVFLREQ